MIFWWAGQFMTNSLILAGAVIFLILLCWLGWRLLGFIIRHLPAPLLQLHDRTRYSRARLNQRFPAAYEFIARRLRRDRFTGLPLTLFALAAVYLLILLTDIIEELISEQELQHIDESINNALTPLRDAPSLQIFNWLTELGASNALSAIAIISALFLWVYQRGFLIVPLLLTITGSQLTTWLGKFGFARPRPEFITEVTAISPSFPSAHATSSLAVLGFIAYALAREPQSTLQRYLIVYWLAVLIGLIGFSRMVLSVHYASDVAAGFLVGGFWLLLGIAWAEYLRQ